jgi:hypothetical protein
MLLLAGLVWLTWWLLGRTTSGDGAGIANVLALPVALLGLAVAVYGWWIGPWSDEPDVLARAARKLLDQIVAAEAHNLQRLLGDTGDTQPADVGFTQLATIVHWRTDGGDGCGSLATIASYYHGLRRGRLVILGEAGAGKTVLAIKLLIDLARECRSAAEPTGRIRIPVRLSLPAFLSGSATSVTVGRDQLDAWIAGHVATVHGLNRVTAEALVKEGWVIPILDGLDEMDPEGTEPIRAQAIIEVLNLPTSTDILRPVVLTCRTAHYSRLSRPDIDEKGVALQDATAVTVQPLDVSEVARWLTYRFPDLSQTDGLQLRWQPVIAHLRKHPDGPLASALKSPLRLYLAVTIHQNPGSVPAELCELDQPALEEHLFSRLIPAIADHHPKPDGTRYDAEDVARWLRTFADHLAWMGMRGLSGIDLHLRELWRTTGNPARAGWGVRWFAASAITSVYAIVLIWLFTTATAFRLNVADTKTGLLVILGLLLLVVFIFVESRRNEACFPISPTRALQLGIAGALGIILAGGLIRLIGTNCIGGLAMGVPLGLVHGLLFALASPRSARKHTATRPSDQIRRALAHDLIADATAGVACATLFCVALGLVSGQPSARMAGLFAGIIIGVTTGRILLVSPWPRYALTVAKLSWRHALPRRPGQFLNWAYSAGLLRLAGHATQFRHRELQIRLTTPPTSTSICQENALLQFAHNLAQLQVDQRQLARSCLPLCELDAVKEVALKHVRDLDVARAHAASGAVNRNQAAARVRDLASGLDYALNRGLACALDAAIVFSHDRGRNSKHDFSGDLSRVLALDLRNVRDLARDRDIDLIRDRALDCVTAVDMLHEMVDCINVYNQTGHTRAELPGVPTTSHAKPLSSPLPDRPSILASVAHKRSTVTALLLVVASAMALVVNYGPVFPELEGDWIQIDLATNSRLGKLDIADDRFTLESDSVGAGAYCEGTISRTDAFYSFAEAYKFTTIRGTCPTFIGSPSVRDYLDLHVGYMTLNYSRRAS